MPPPSPEPDNPREHLAPGSFELLAYFKDLWDNGFNHALHIVGSADIVYHPEMQTMGQIVNRNYNVYIKKGLLRLHGKIPPTQIENYLQDAHVVIVPSIIDNLPYVVMEAMNLGKIVLASKQGGQQEMIKDGVTGFLFDHEIPSSFNIQLHKILALTDESVQQIGANAHRYVRDTYCFKNIGKKKTLLLDALKLKITFDKKRHFPFPEQEPYSDKHIEAEPGSLLSVIVPYYNMGEYIEECIRSISESTYSDLEIIIIDDGSTEKSSIDRLHTITPAKNLRVVHHCNQGLAFTRNYGAQIAKGSYLAFLDADDKVDPTYYEKAIHALSVNDNVFFVGAWVQYFGNSQQIWPTFTPQPPYALIHNPVNSSALVYKRAAFLSGGLNDKKVGYGLEDYESVINMLSHGFNGIVLPEILFYYRVRTGSMFRNISTEKLIYSNKYIAKKHNDYYAKFAVQLINLLNANGPGFLFDNPTFPVRVSSKSVERGVFLSKVKAFIKRNEKLKGLILTIKNFKR